MVLELPVRRLRQVTAAIRRRMRAEQLFQATLIEWQAKTISSFVVAVSMADPKGKKSLMGELEKLTLLRDAPEKPKVSQVASSERLEQMFGGAPQMLGGE